MEKHIDTMALSKIVFIPTGNRLAIGQAALALRAEVRILSPQPSLTYVRESKTKNIIIT